MLTISVDDQVTAWLEWASEEFPALRRKAMKSLGWDFQKKIKAGIRSGSPGGRAYAAFMPPDKRRKLEKVFGNRGKKEYKPLGRLAAAVGYQYQEATGGVIVGWLSHSAVNIGTKMEKGFQKTVTPKLRRAYFAAGLGISKPIITVPARPTFEPMREVLTPGAAAYVEGKIWEYLGKGAPPVGTSRRRYLVRG